ncbi:hypothetical protein [Streptomyces sp. NPDC048111]
MSDDKSSHRARLAGELLKRFAVALSVRALWAVVREVMHASG